MLNNAKIIAFVATTDAAKSRAFYEEVLGLAPTLEDEFAIVLDANGVELRIQKVQTLTPPPHTQLGWSVNSLEEVLRALRAKGVVFESYPFMQQDALGIWTAPSTIETVFCVSRCDPLGYTHLIISLGGKNAD